MSKKFVEVILDNDLSFNEITYSFFSFCSLEDHRKLFASSKIIKNALQNNFNREDLTILKENFLFWQEQTDTYNSDNNKYRIFEIFALCFNRKYSIEELKCYIESRGEEYIARYKYSIDYESSRYEVNPLIKYYNNSSTKSSLHIFLTNLLQDYNNNIQKPKIGKLIIDIISSMMWPEFIKDIIYSLPDYLMLKLRGKALDICLKRYIDNNYDSVIDNLDNIDSTELAIMALTNTKIFELIFNGTNDHVIERLNTDSLGAIFTKYNLLLNCHNIYNVEGKVYHLYYDDPWSDFDYDIDQTDNINELHHTDSYSDTDRSSEGYYSSERFINSMLHINDIIELLDNYYKHTNDNDLFIKNFHSICEKDNLTNIDNAVIKFINTNSNIARAIFYNKFGFIKDKIHNLGFMDCLYIYLKHPYIKTSSLYEYINSKKLLSLEFIYSLNNYDIHHLISNKYILTNLLNRQYEYNDQEDEEKEILLKKIFDKFPPSLLEEIFLYTGVYTNTEIYESTTNIKVKNIIDQLRNSEESLKINYFNKYDNEPFLNNDQIDLLLKFYDDYYSNSFE